MFRVEDRSVGGSVRQVFLHTNPKKQGYEGPVEDGVHLDYDMNHIHSWPYGEFRPTPCLARDPKNPKNYKVFKNEDERERAGYEFVAFNAPVVFNFWREYAAASNVQVFEDAR